MSDKGKPTDFTPMEPAAPSPWDDSVEFQLSKKDIKQLKESPLTSDISTESAPSETELNTLETVADHPIPTPPVIESNEKSPQKVAKEAQSSTTVREHISPQTAPEAVTRVTTMPMRPQVKSSKLMPVGREPESQLKDKPPQTVTVRPFRTAQTPPPNTVMKGVSILTMLVLFEAFSLPRLTQSGTLTPPWELVLQPGGITFHCALLLVILFLFTSLSIKTLFREVGLCVTSLIGLMFAIRHIQFEIQSFGFRGHIAIVETFTNSLSLSLILMGTIGLPAALFWRSRYTSSIGSRIGVALSLSLVVIVMTAPLGVSGAKSSLIGVAYETIQSGTALRADVISSYLLIAATITLIPMLLSFRQHPQTGFAAFWAGLFVTLIGLIPVIQALYVANFKDGGWKYTLGPLKAALFLYGILLLASVALGHSAGSLLGQRKR